MFLPLLDSILSRIEFKYFEYTHDLLGAHLYKTMSSLNIDLGVC